MASYGLAERFKTPKDCFRILDPAAYDVVKPRSFVPNKCPFNSSAPRKTMGQLKLTDAIYDAAYKYHVPTATSLKSKVPRFAYESFKQEDIDEILCRCGIDNPCECPIEDEEVTDVVCQAEVPKRFYTGPPPHSSLAAGISIPTKRDYGFEVLPDGSLRRLLKIPQETSPPFYNSKVEEATKFYQGCKWSKWTSTRKQEMALEKRPGPADYTIEPETNPQAKCDELLREERRKYSQNLRYLDLEHRRNILEGRPGPAHYRVQVPKCTGLKFLGPKAERFSQKQEKSPGPGEYAIKRAFDLPEPPEKPCHVELPEPAFFGVKAKRFRTIITKSPGPADYDADVKIGRILNCNENAPFGTSALRFKEEKNDDDDDDEDDCIVQEQVEEDSPCPNLTWQFRSKTKRFVKHGQVFDAEFLGPAYHKFDIPEYRQRIAPFFTSEGRFQPWYNWLPNNKTLEASVGPGYYSLEIPKLCNPAVTSGPTFRSPRFPRETFVGPAPNEYKLKSSLDEVTTTYNLRLKKNVENHKKAVEDFGFKYPVEPTILSPLQKELKVLDRAIEQLEVDDDEMRNYGKVRKVIVPASAQTKKYNAIMDKLLEPEAEAKMSVVLDYRLHGKVDSIIDEEKDPSSQLVGEIPKCGKNITKQVVEIMPVSIEKKKKPKVDDKNKPKQKLLRTFLYKHYYPVPC